LDREKKGNEMKTKPLSLGVATMAALTLVISGCSAQGEDGELTEVIFAQPVPESVIQWPSYVADELGYFAEEGIKIQLAPASDSLSMAAFVTNGSALISGAGASEVLFATREGAEITVLMDWWTKSAEGIVALEGSGVEKLEDLEGLKVGVSSEEDETFLATALGFVGLTLDDVDTVVTGAAGGTTANALRQGEINAFSGAVSDFAALQAAGVDLVDITPPDIIATPASSMMVDSAKFEENRDVIIGFLRAYAKATYAGLYDPDALQAMSIKRVPDEWRDIEAGRALLEVVLENTKPDDMARIGAVRTPIWETAQRQLIAVGELSEEQDLSQILDDSFIDEINDWDRAEVEADVRAWLEANPS
jgi:NitT/TauT family transport system substrate-binding protein